ncbi:MAG: D-alanyl-D-alanine carboxypeptidase family protein, partial [Coprobacillus cateniformis]
MKTPKRSYYNQKRSFSKRILIIPIVVICLTVLMFFQWTRIQLAFKGYSLTEQNMILKLDDEEIKSFLNNDKINSLESWNELENENHYQEYAYYQKLHSQLSKKDVIAYIDTFYQKYYDKLKELNYSDDVLCQMMKKAQLSDFEYITKQNLNYQQTKSYLDITGVIYTDLKAYIDSQKQPLEAVLSISYPFINS